MLRRAIDQCGRPIVLSLSPGKTDYNQIEHLHQHANQWRMMDDLWDRWDDVKAVFKEAAFWSQHHVQGCYADCDMLPLGRISMTVGDPGYCNADNGRKTKLTRDEQRTLMSLWGICHSPLMFGGEMTKNDAFTLSLLTNRDYLRMHAAGQQAHEVSNDHGRIVWTSTDPDNGDRWIALFYADEGNGWIVDQDALYASEVVAYTTDGHKVDVDMALPEGSTELALVVDDAGDGNDYDHGDWLNPVFVMQDGTELPITGEYVKEKYTNSYYNTINENQNVTGTGKMKVLGQEYDRGFSMDANAMILLRVPEGAVGFRGTGALDDSGIGQPGANSRTSIRFYVFNKDPRLEKNSGSATTSVSCDLTQFGYDADDQLTVYDVWSGEQLLTMQPAVLTQDVNRHGVRLLRITSAKQSAAVKEVKRPFDPAIQRVAYTLDGKKAATSQRGIRITHGHKVVMR
ncbi:MAG: NPCBM/NEW2 domain-containing protein, partial [Prevotella sp.]|nr:NPCBM/NEW2 domain-containing protein [Prevotella sp.]